jgi:hypothetical protein
VIQEKAVSRLRPASQRIIRASAVLLSIAAQVASASQDARPLYELDEVQVLGSRLKLSEVRTAIVQTEDRFYALLNQLLDDPEMSVTCDVGPPLGTHLHKRICGPQFIATARAEFARVWIGEVALQNVLLVPSYGSFTPPESPGAAIGHNEIVLQSKVVDLMKSNSDLRDLARRRAMLEILLKAAQKARWNGRK